MKNKPYVKQYDKSGLLINPIDQHNPYLTQFKTQQSIREDRKYLKLNGLKVKIGGNNRKPCERTGKSRLKHLLN